MHAIMTWLICGGAILGAGVWTFMVVGANGMSDAPGKFQGGWTILAAWAVAGLLIASLIF